MRYIDSNGLIVVLEFKDDNNQKNANHVLAIPVYKGRLVFTEHSVRGIEFPGGKVEQDETSEEAVKRELFEETGSYIKNMKFIATYTVYDQVPFSKDVYFVEIEKIETQNNYFETKGPVIKTSIDDIPEDEKSFLLKDKAILKCLERVYHLGFYK